jgi:GT2 family glycosyltransferase
MSRPAVSVVMPFAGDLAAARAALQTLSELHIRPGDELILADNSGILGFVDGIRVVRAVAEHSPAHARNVGAEHAQCDWILFLDSDCRLPGGLIDAYFRRPIDADVGAVAGEVAPVADDTRLAARYGAARSFLGQAAHLAHPYLPRAAAANLLVRRAAFEQLGGFYEGVRAAEDTDFSWRLQRAGWRLELRPDACVEHRYRTTVSGLTRQWRGYAAGRAWLGRRYDGFAPESAVRRASGRAWLALRRRRAGVAAAAVGPQAAAASAAGPQAAAASDAAQKARPPVRRYLILDLLLGVQELIGLTLSNRPEPGPPSTRRSSPGSAAVVLVAGRFPAQGDPLGEFARSLDRARVEAAARPESLQREVARALTIDYREDDGSAGRALALARLVLRHPLRCARDRAHRRPGEPTLAELAPAAGRLAADSAARIVPIGGRECDLVASRLTALAGRGISAGEA